MMEISAEHWETYLLLEHQIRIANLLSGNFRYGHLPLYHYARLGGMQGILTNQTLRFTDCEDLDDTTEYFDAIEMLHQTLDEVRTQYPLEFLEYCRVDERHIYETMVYFTNTVQNGNDQEIVVSQRQCRNFVFCTTTEFNNQYLWSDDFAGHAGFFFGLNIIGLPLYYNRLENQHQCIFSFGRVLYSPRAKINLLRNLIEIEYSAWHEHGVPLSQVSQNFQNTFNEIRVMFKIQTCEREEEFRIAASMPIENLNENVEVNGITYRVIAREDGRIRRHADIRFPTLAITSIFAGRETTGDSIRTIDMLREQNGIPEPIRRI